MSPLRLLGLDVVGNETLLRLFLGRGGAVLLDEADTISLISSRGATMMSTAN